MNAWFSYISNICSYSVWWSVCSASYLWRPCQVDLHLFYMITLVFKIFVFWLKMYQNLLEYILTYTCNQELLLESMILFNGKWFLELTIWAPVVIIATSLSFLLCLSMDKFRKYFFYIETNPEFILILWFKWKVVVTLLKFSYFIFPSLDSYAEFFGS